MAGFVTSHQQQCRWTDDQGFVVRALFNQVPLFQQLQMSIQATERYLQLFTESFCRDWFWVYCDLHQQLQ
ncbi:Uncharacterised protein [Vibrio cholerae]|nr:Uncharacterised protein [Vibrio cholerae]